MQGLVSTKDTEIRHRILNRLDNEPNITLHEITEDWQRYISVKQDSKKIEESGIAHIRNIRYNKTQTKSPTKINESKQRKPPTKSNELKNKKKYLPTNPCSRCGAVHWYKNCTFQDMTCSICNRVGHKSSHCRSKNNIINCIKNARPGEPDDTKTRKFVHVKMLNKSVKFQLNSASDLMIFNLQSWKKWVDQPWLNLLQFQDR